MRIVCVAGARPNYMKVKPVMDALEERGAEVALVHTGQHYDAAMNDVFFSDLGIRPPDHYLQVGSGSHATQTGKVMTAFEPWPSRVRNINICSVVEFCASSRMMNALFNVRPRM